MPLPAPYAPPWKRLGEDLVATAAWLGLKARELWRRNGEGTLPVPGFWPRRWAGLFWPLVVALVLGGGLALGRLGLVGGVGAGSVRDGKEGSAEVELGGGPASTGLGAAVGGASGGGASRPEPPSLDGSGPEESLPGDAGPGANLFLAPGHAPTDATGERAPEAPLDGDGDSDAPSAGPEAPSKEASSDGEADRDQVEKTPTDLDRLRAVLPVDAPDGPILALIPDPAAATLTLELAESFSALPADQRQHLAERWQRGAEGEGYGHLRLRDGRGRPLGRDALVGGGMVLLEPPRPLPAPP
ncbi:MAG: hypothetical protein VKP70_01420 [Cyanobacteriota bacterium]|nr:hypothetical protein [Cyanobacteriota bacterium]